MVYCHHMKKFFLTLVLGLALVTPSFAFADIAPDPSWLPTYDTEAPADAEPEDASSTPTENDVLTEAEIYDEPMAPSTESSEIWAAFAVVLYITIIVEMIVAAVVIALLRRPMHSVIAVPIASLVTLPILWSAAYAGADSGALTSTNWFLALVLAEVVVIVVEAVILHAMHPTAISKRQALIVSGVMNVASVLVGFLLGIGG